MGIYRLWLGTAMMGKQHRGSHNCEYSILNTNSSGWRDKARSICSVEAKENSDLSDQSTFRMA